MKRYLYCPDTDLSVGRMVRWKDICIVLILTFLLEGWLDEKISALWCVLSVGRTIRRKDCCSFLILTCLWGGLLDEKIVVLSWCWPFCEKDCYMKRYLIFPDADLSVGRTVRWKDICSFLMLTFLWEGRLNEQIFGLSWCWPFCEGKFWWKDISFLMLTWLWEGQLDEKISGLSWYRPVCEKDCKIKSYLFFPNADLSVRTVRWKDIFSSLMLTCL